MMKNSEIQFKHLAWEMEGASMPGSDWATTNREWRLCCHQWSREVLLSDLSADLCIIQFILWRLKMETS